MSKNKAIKVVTAAVIAGSAITAVAPAQSEAATNSVDKAITKAHNQINKAFNAYYKEARFDNKLPSTSQIRKEAKLARDYYEAAKKQISKNGGSKSKKAAYLKKLDTKKQSLTRVENYVKAINVNVAAKKVAFESAVKGGTQSKVLAAQTALDQKNAEFKKAVAKVFGPDARRLLTSKYYTPADKLSATVDNEMAVYRAYRDIERKDLIEKDLAAAEKLIASTEKYVAKIEKKNTKLAQNIMKAVKKNKAAYEKAKAGTVTSQKQLDAILAKAKDGDKVEIKVNATESLKIATTKALTITLTGDFKKKDLTIDAPNTHVTNKAANSGKVTINDVSNTSYEQVGSYSSLVFNDTNGGRIINSTSAPLNITIAAGAKVTLVGNFGKVTVLGNAEVTLAANTIVQEVATDTAITVITEEGAKVEKTTGSGTVTVTPPTPVTPPVGGGGGGSTPDYVQVNLSQATTTVDLSGAADSRTFDGIQVTGATLGSDFVVKSVKTNRNQEPVKINKSIPIIATTMTITPAQILGDIANGATLGTLRSVLGGGDIVIDGVVESNSSGVADRPVTITIKLGSSVGSPIIKNDYFKIEKKGIVNGQKTAEVTIYTDKDVTLGALFDKNDIDFSAILARNAFNDPVITGGAATTVEAVEAELLKIIDGNKLELAKLSSLVDKTITLNGYTVTFKAE
ncbi:hypothetical protein D1953_12865 [Peribacillus asahii]|uniref:SbsC C-terminal domain-containing protein n=1 Tax=Peribacillus asahii TaxID=228899 RepID=A0A398B5B7_9BACI|nr:hypothetical protein [Peribacillus asahii]RID84751.1 hypothetical protein D1953_12865 [Peribacillus asahii]